jgi:hypothetical protein
MIKLNLNIDYKIPDEFMKGPARSYLVKTMATEWFVKYDLVISIT